MSYVIEHSVSEDTLPVKLSITIEPLDIVHTHEETKPDILKRLSEDIRKNGYQRDPVIIDSISKVILDGMHRANALRYLDCDYIAVCEVDYTGTQELQLRNWYRILTKDISSRELRKTIEKVEGVETEEGIDFDRAKEMVDSRVALSAALHRKEGEDNCLVIYSDDNESALPYDEVLLPKGKRMPILSAYWRIFQVEKAIESRYGPIVDHVIDENARHIVRKKDMCAVIMTPVVKKEEVQHFKDLPNEVNFPPKATRHVLPARPLRIKTPLSMLYGRDGTDLEKIRAEFEILLRHKIVKKELPKKGEPYLGQYTEPVYVFD